MTIIEAIKEAEEVLFEKGIPDYKFDARELARRSLGLTDAEIIARYNDVMPKNAEEVFLKMLKKRLKKKPMAYITGMQGFYGHEFKVGRGVLIPRSDTEILVENAIKTYKEINKNDEDYSDEIIIDMCTGSGCIGISTALEIPSAKVYGVDISGKAIKYAKMNKKLNNAENFEIIKSDLFDYFEKGKNKERFEGKVSMIISNPPYIETKVYKNLDKSVKGYEPRLALDGGKTGKDFYKRILYQSKKLLKKGGIVAFEIDYMPKYVNDVREFFEYFGFDNIKVIKDYNGKDRVMIGTLH